MTTNRVTFTTLSGQASSSELEETVHEEQQSIRSRTKNTTIDTGVNIIHLQIKIDKMIFLGLPYMAYISQNLFVSLQQSKQSPGCQPKN